MLCRSDWSAWPVAVALLSLACAPIALPTGASVGAAQPVLFLTPDTHDARIGERVRLNIAAAAPNDAGPPAPAEWPPDGPGGVAWLFVRVAGCQANRPSAEMMPGDGPADNRPPGGGPGAAILPIEIAGVTLVGVDFEPIERSIGGGDFASFLGARTATPADVVRAIDPAAVVRVRHRMSAKTLIRAAPAPGDAPPAQDASTAVSKSGQSVEIRPLFDPTSIKVGSDLPFRVYAADDARGLTRLLVWPPIVDPGAPAMPRSITTDAKAIGAVRIDRPGRWCVEFHYAQRVPAAGRVAGEAPLPAQAEWDLGSATLTFDVPAAPPAGDAGARQPAAQPPPPPSAPRAPRSEGRDGR